MPSRQAFNPFRNDDNVQQQKKERSKIPLHQRRREQAQRNNAASFPPADDGSSSLLNSNNKIDQIPWPTGWDDGFLGGSAEQIDPWGQPELIETSFDSSRVSTIEGPSTLDTSFDTFFTAIDEADDGRFAHRALDTNLSSAASTKRKDDEPATGTDASFQTPTNDSDLETVQVSLNERLSILFDDLSAEPSCTVIGSVYVEPSQRIQSPVYLTFKDRKGYVERWEAEPSSCRNVTAAFPHLSFLEQSDQIFEVPSVQDAETLRAPIVAYSCIPKLRPVPMLLKTKLQRIKDGCKLGVRIRANPNNTYTLQNMGIVVAVPPDISGEKVTTQPSTGEWDDLKRVLSWPVDALRPGESVDLQANFSTGNGSQQVTSKSPVIVRCDCDTLYSRIGVLGESVDASTPSVKVQVSKSARVLYRKV